MISLSEGAMIRECHDRKIAKTCLFRSLTLKGVTFRKWEQSMLLEENPRIESCI